jgi:hypothetical protein
MRALIVMCTSPKGVGIVSRAVLAASARSTHSREASLAGWCDREDAHTGRVEADYP